MSINFKKNNLADFLGLFLIPFLSAGFVELLRVSGGPQYKNIIIEIISGLLSFLLLFVLFIKKENFFGIPSIIIVTFFGIILWWICNFIHVIYIDWWYISKHPEDFYERHIVFGFRFLIGDLIFGMPITLGIIFLSRIIINFIFDKKNTLQLK